MIRDLRMMLFDKSWYVMFECESVSSLTHKPTQVQDTTLTRSMFRALDLMIINGISLNLETAKIALSIVTKNLNKRSLSFAMQTFLRFESIAEDVMYPDKENCFQDNGVEAHLNDVRDRVERAILKECVDAEDLDFLDALIVRGCLYNTETCVRFRNAVFERCSDELALEVLKRMQYYGAEIRSEEIKRIENRLGAYVEKLADSGNTQHAKRVLESSQNAGLDYTISGWTALALWDNLDDDESEED